MNRCTPELLTDILQMMYDSSWTAKYYQSMAISGQSGTLRTALKNPIFHNRVHAKTGFIVGARGLSGYISSSEGENLAFSILINREDSQLTSFYRIVEDILFQLATFNRNIPREVYEKLNI